jgi:carbon monoxide dehydrogenase subunit G
MAAIDAVTGEPAAADSIRAKERHRMPTLNESFTVPNPDQSWGVITDLNKLIPCVPGAKVLEASGPKSAKAEITVNMGSMGMKFTGPVTIESINGQTAQIKANTREAGGQSNAAGDVTISMSGSQVNISAVANVSGKAASMGEGTVTAVLTQLVKAFAGNLAKA